MSRPLQIFFCLAAILAAFSVPAQFQPAIPPGIIPGATNVNLMPPTPAPVPSPVLFFRQLLVMTPGERNSALTNRPPEARARIQAKVREYLALDPDERELRLRATELRWYLTPLMRMPPASREPRLAQLPADLRSLVQSRLTQWDLLPPPLQKQLLDNEQALHYFASPGNTNRPAASPEQQKNAEQFNRFFEFTPKEKRQTLATLSDTERAAMEKTLQTFEKLPLKERLQCLRNYEKFASMSPAERTEFLKNAEAWSKLSPKERQSWRDLVAHVPIMPPMPAPAPPAIIMPPFSPKMPRPGMATN